MATCDMGFEHEAAVPVAEPAVIDAGPNENAVEIAKIEAKASLERERIYAEEQRARLEAENEALRQQATNPPVVVVETDASPKPVIEPEPEPEPDTEAEPPENPHPVTAEPKGGKHRAGWWDAYKK